MQTRHKIFAVFISLQSLAFAHAYAQQLPDSSRSLRDSSRLPVAYGLQPAWQITSAQSHISGDQLRPSSAATLSNALYGRLPGLTVLQGSGEPGYDVPGLAIRGLASYRNTDILTFVDGFESPFDQLTADEIDKITVLKDAAATAMYGMRGANGVLLVTTKRGMAGKPKITFGAQTGWQSPTRLPEFLDSYNYATLYNEARRNDGQPERYSAADLEAYRSQSDPYFHPDVNWYDEVLKKSAPMSNYQLNVSGGNDNARFFVLLNVLKNTGLYKNTDRKREENSNANFLRYNFRSNVDINVTKRLSASLDLAGRVEDRTYPGTGAGNIWDNMMLIPPNAFPVKNPDGSYGGASIYRNNPVGLVLAKGVASTHDRNMQATMRLKYDLDQVTKGLAISGAISFNNWFRGNDDKQKDFAVYQLLRGTSGDTIYNKFGDNTTASVNDGQNNQWRRTNTLFNLTYDRSFGKSDINALLQYQQDVYTISGNNVPFAHQGAGGRITYSYSRKYIAELTFGYNGSENFPKGKRFGFFPALSAGWILSREAFLQSAGWIDFLKLRASYGLAGNDQVGGRRFPYQQYYYGGNGYYFGTDNHYAGGMDEGSLGNPNVTWEKARKANIGVEGNFFRNRLNFVLDVFHERRTDILAERSSSIPGYIGVGLPSENIGIVNNKGLEVSLGFEENNAKGIGYFINASASYAHNKIEYMAEAQRPFAYLNRTGQSIGQPFGLQAIGFFKDEAEIAASPRQTFAPVKPGDIKYKDQNGDGIIDIYDEVAIGKPSIAAWTFGLHTGIRFKGLSLEAFFQGATGRSVMLQGPLVWAFVNDAKAAPLALGRWTPETAATATYPRLTTTANDNNYRASDFWQRNGNFLRLRNVELGYTLPAKVSKIVSLQQTYLYVNAVNLFTIDAVKLTDPEVLIGYPVMKSVNIGIRVQM
ncbi:TonB-linked outer membrane protein, SusC/RagA family [Chitinophaga terrae (ex Kim and Jung 2007)]|uniref:TonB-linked outer membrane protein, SusC/RagA family n=1 Tax=Chitinophaga terrae (ex Kim and Jung 2007) TaxID=408074 RepID=A0A1H3YK61_9BACT|nr:TonB-dependent receptor [Chitinophaga terrae (ex Kim and Jung 2007)]GEP88368.1 SusC/RagA family TonB-linked outer membrane protein [Chitinophaga terrae (ex Kim and Jung 2007)]SEA11966.1 TonB-linked outer membrane protein, SusC/RagA family [Chitinophaga terrae (ex Kim and Jung 2007)]